MLGLLEAVIGRGEYFVGMQGVMLLRQYLLDLFHAENGQSPAGGAKRAGHLLTGEQTGLLAAQPPLVADREQVIAAHLAATCNKPSTGRATAGRPRASSENTSSRQ